MFLKKIGYTTFIKTIKSTNNINSTGVEREQIKTKITTKTKTKDEKTGDCRRSD